MNKTEELAYAVMYYTRKLLCITVEPHSIVNIKNYDMSQFHIFSGIYHWNREDVYKEK